MKLFVLGLLIGIFWDGMISIFYHVMWKSKLWRWIKG